MGLLSNKISRDEVRPGDHIYSWRKAFLYAHHGIYVGNGKVIHFTCGTKSFIASSSPNHGVNPCPTCGHRSQDAGVLSSCLDCFLAGGSLYRFEYSASSITFLAKPRGGACTTVPSDLQEEVCRRAEYLLENGFAAYHVRKNNCESFAVYCKTGLVFIDKAATSSQAFSGFKTLKIMTGATAVTGFASMGGLLVGAAVGSLVVLPCCIGIATCVNIRRLIGDKRLGNGIKVSVEQVSKLINSQDLS